MRKPNIKNYKELYTKEIKGERVIVETEINYEKYVLALERYITFLEENIQ